MIFCRIDFQIHSIHTSDKNRLPFLLFTFKLKNRKCRISKTKICTAVLNTIAKLISMHSVSKSKLHLNDIFIWLTPIANSRFWLSFQKVNSYNDGAKKTNAHSTRLNNTSLNVLLSGMSFSRLSISTNYWMIWLWQFWQCISFALAEKQAT